MAEQEQQLELEPDAPESAEPEKAEAAKPDPQQQVLDELRAEMRRLAEQNAELRGRLSAPQPKPEPAQPRELTRPELQQMVDRGDITETEMEDRLDRQRDVRLRRQIQEDLAAQEAQRKTAAIFQRYRDTIPGLDDPSSESRQRVAREYQKLVAEGLPEGTQTEITALAMAFGPPEKIQERRPKRETHQETSGGGAQSEQRPGPQWQKGMKQIHILEAQRLLDQGYYTGTDDPKFKSYCDYARKSASRRRAA